MKYLLISFFILSAYKNYAQPASNFANMPAKTDNSYPFASASKFQTAPTTGKGLGMLFTFKEDTLAMLLEQVSQKSIKKNLFFLAGDKCQSTNGDSIAADFVAQWITQHNLSQQLPGSIKQVINGIDNVAVIEGSDKKAGYVIFIAHRNHRLQSFDSSLYTANDNASSSVTLMECAKAIAGLSKEDIYPKRTIIFICTTDKENTSSNSDYLAVHPTVSSSKMNFELNIEMLSRRLDTSKAGNNYMYSLYYDSVYTAKNMVQNVNQKNNLPSEADNKTDKKNYKQLMQKTKLALAVLWKLAND